MMRVSFLILLATFPFRFGSLTGTTPYPLGDFACDEVVEHLFDPLVIKMHAKSVASFLHCDARSIRTANGGELHVSSCHEAVDHVSEKGDLGT